MATTKQRSAAKRNIRKAQTAARKKRTISKAPRSVRQDLGRQAAAARRRGGAGRVGGPDPAAALRAGEEGRHPGPIPDGQVGADPGAAPIAVSVGGRLFSGGRSVPGRLA